MSMPKATAYVGVIHAATTVGAAAWKAAGWALMLFCTAWCT